MKVSRLLLFVLMVGCGPSVECDGDEVPHCPEGCAPLCADDELRGECDEAGCTWLDGTSAGPQEVYCLTLEDAPNDAYCADPRQSPRCACE